MLSNSVAWASSIAAMLIITLQPAVAWAGTLPPYQIEVVAGSLHTELPGVIVTDCNATGVCDATAELLPLVFAEGAGGGSGTTSSSAVLSYQFEIDGPSVGVTIPIDIDGSALFNSDNGTAAGGVLYGLFNSSKTWLYLFNCTHSTTGNNCPDQPGFFHLPTVALSGVAITIQLEVAGSTSSGTYFSQIDPTITIDPSFPDASLYSISFSSGIGAPSDTVPEPSTFLLIGAVMLLCLGRKVLRQSPL
jgi:hypothetical protein